ncbi:MAG: hypothetical protein FD180_1074 [Planctomycetota bacterium]|nr:MAG: hypothetical protein FD180_1074 [Planctomycetota bacterium]
MTRGIFVSHELARLARFPRTYGVRFMFVGALLGLAALIWPWNSGLQELYQGSTAIFKVFFVTEMVLAMLVVPALVAPAIPAEREAGTLELLVSCPEPEGGIVLGKLVSHAMLVVAVLAAGFPVAFASSLLGGVPIGRAAMSCGHILMTAAFASCLALRCSMTFRGAMTATMAALLLELAIVALSYIGSWFVAGFVTDAMPLVAAYAVFVVLAMCFRWKAIHRFPRGCLLFFAAGAFFLGLVLAMDPPRTWRMGSIASVRSVIHVLCPWTASFEDTLGSNRLPWGDVLLSWTVLALGCGAALVGAFRRADSEILVSGVRAVPRAEKDAADAAAERRRLRREREQKEQRSRGITPVALVSQDWFRVHPRAEERSAAQVNPFLPVGRDPVFWMETSWDRYPALILLRDLSALVVWPAAIAGILTGWTQSSDHVPMHIELALLCILAATVGSATLAPDRENGTLPVLLSTGYPAARIVNGKMLAALHWFRPLALPIALHLAVVILFHGAPMAGAAAILIAAPLAVLGISVAISGASKRPRLAFALTAVVVGVFWTLPAVLSPGWRELGALSTNPFGALAEVVWLTQRHSVDQGMEHLAVFMIVTLAAAVLAPAVAVMSLERKVRR